MNNFLQLVFISRPRFWLYLAGPFLVGSMAAYNGDRALFLSALLFLIYFTFPANLLVYGVNDIYDYETDKLNPKKQQYEQLLSKDSHKFLWKSIFALNVPFILLLIAWPNVDNKPILLLHFTGFLFFSAFYSTPPIRAKTKPFLDSAFNILYIFPASVAYYLLNGQHFSWKAFLAGGVWAMAMHAFSAIPDIEADKKAGIETIATKLKKNGTLLWCAVCYILSAVLSYSLLGPMSLILLGIYLSVLCLAFLKKDIFSIYRVFPIINTLAGFLIFLFLAWQRVQWAT